MKRRGTSLLLQVTKDSLAKVAEMQDRLTEAHARFVESSKRVQEVESERRKLEFSLQQAQVSQTDRQAGRQTSLNPGSPESLDTRPQRVRQDTCTYMYSITYIIRQHSRTS